MEIVPGRILAPVAIIAEALPSTTVFNLGRMLDIFLPTKPPAIAAVVARATAAAPEARPSSVAELQREWRSALPEQWASGIARIVAVEGSEASPAS